MNKVKNYRREKVNLPIDIARDKNLDPTINPNEASFLEPIGSHKGFALAYMVELLTSGLTNQSHSKFLMPMYGTDLKEKRGVSHSFIILNPKFLGDEIIDSLMKCVTITSENVSLNQSSLIIPFYHFY